jgi:hypothetical protein
MQLGFPSRGVGNIDTSILFEVQKNPLDRAQTYISVHSNILGCHIYAETNDNPVDYLRDCFPVRHSDGKWLKQCEVDSGQLATFRNILFLSSSYYEFK